jgi:uncharacterized protein YkwD
MLETSHMQKSGRLFLFPVLMAVFVWLTACDNPFGPSNGSAPGDIEKEIFKLVNDYRLSIGKSGLTRNETLDGIARGHSQDMADGKVPFGHDGFYDRMALVGQTIPWTAAAELIALSGSAKDAVDTWIQSTEHRINLEGNYDLTGVGVVKAKTGSSFYTTQILIKPR